MAEAITLGWAANFPLDYKAKNVQVFKKYEDFRAMVDKYSTTNVVFDPAKFDTGQVLLVDDGETDNCSQHLAFNGIQFASSDETTVKFTLEYLSIPAIANCQPKVPPDRPYRFYYIPTKKILLTEDKLI